LISNVNGDTVFVYSIETKKGSEAILNLNSNPIVFPLLSLRTRIKKLDT